MTYVECFSKQYYFLRKIKSQFFQKKYYWPWQNMYQVLENSSSQIGQKWRLNSSRQRWILKDAINRIENTYSVQTVFQHFETCL